MNTNRVCPQGQRLDDENVLHIPSPGVIPDLSGPGSRHSSGHVGARTFPPSQPGPFHVQQEVTATQGHQRGPSYLPNIAPRIGGLEPTLGQTTFFPDSSHSLFMRSFQASGMTSFPNVDRSGFPLGNIPAQAFVPRVSPDEIQARNFGTVNGQTSKRARLAYARPLPMPISGRTKKLEHGVTKREVWVPCKMTRPCSYKKGKINITMKKVTQFNALPVRIELHRDTSWGGVYNGDNFLPGSAQLHIAQACSMIDLKNSEWADIPGCFLSKSSFSQLVGIGPKFMGGASIRPLYYPPHAKWSDIQRKPMVYIPNPALQMTAEQLQMYRELARAYEEPVGMNAIEDGEGDEDVEGCQSTDNVGDTDINCPGNNIVRLSDDVDGSTEFSDEDPRTMSTTNESANTQGGNEEGNTFSHEVDIDDSTSEGTPTEEYNVVEVRGLPGPPNVNKDNHPPRTRSYERHGIGYTQTIGSCSRQPVRQLDLRMNQRSRHNFCHSSQSVRENEIPRESQSLYNTSGASLVHDISSEDDIEDPMQRRSPRPGNMVRGEAANDEFDMVDDSSGRITRRYEELFNSWLLASEEYNMVINNNSKEAKTSTEHVVSNSAANEGYTLVVDLGDLGGAFWECFDAACHEDSDAALEVQTDLESLATSRLRRHGLMKEMVENRLPKILSHVSSLAVYNARNVEMFFDQAAMPNWQTWVELASVLEVDVVDMKSVEDSQDWLVSQFQGAKTTLQKSAMTIQGIMKLRDEYLHWKEKDIRLSRERLATSEESYKILTAKKKESHALHQLTVYHIAYNSLAKFRQYHEKAKHIYIEVNQGAELTAIRNMCQKVLNDNVIFGDIRVTYIAVTSNYSLRERTTIDAGGLTDRLLTQAWSMLFNSSGEFHSVFEKGDLTNHLSATDPDINPQRQSDIILARQLMFLIALKQQRVTRETTMATIALAMGKVPDRASIRGALENKENNMYIEDYKRFRPNEFSLMSLLHDGGINNAQESIGMITSNMTDDCLRFGKLSIDSGEEQFQKDVRNIMAGIIYETLFVRCSRVGKYLRQGFHSLINTVTTSPMASEIDKKEVISQSFNGVEVSAMGAFFSAEQVVTASEFLSRVDFEAGFPEDLKSMFFEGVQKFTCPEACRLYAFVTDEKFNRGTRCSVKCNRKASLDSLPRAATCTKTLELPRYTTVCQLVQKLSLATYSTDYGHA